MLETTCPQATHWRAQLTCVFYATSELRFAVACLSSTASRFARVASWAETELYFAPYRHLTTKIFVGSQIITHAWCVATDFVYLEEFFLRNYELSFKIRVGKRSILLLSCVIVVHCLVFFTVAKWLHDWKFAWRNQSASFSPEPWTLHP